MTTPTKMSVWKGLAPMDNNKLALASAALQDHISKKFLFPRFSVSDPLLKCRRKVPPKIKKSQSIVNEDTGKDREYVIDEAPAPLTLAERLGLVAGPAMRLSENQWSLVKIRSVQQGESARPCAVCKEEFQLKPQVLLSCSHIFHRACVEAFEKFSGRKCCPVCRRQRYETRVIHDAAHLYRHHCATRIQALWRGYSRRKWYQNVQKSRCPREKLLRRRFFEAKLQELSDSFVQHCHIDTEAFLSEIDHSLSSSRRVFEELQRKHVSEPPEEHWDTIQRQVIQRGVWDCPICLTPLHKPSVTERDSANNSPHRHSVLLSCSHLFHQHCLESCESFSADGRLSCPVCRSAYHKRRL